MRKNCLNHRQADLTNKTVANHDDADGYDDDDDDDANSFIQPVYSNKIKRTEQRNAFNSL